MAKLVFFWLTEISVLNKVVNKHTVKPTVFKFCAEEGTVLEQLSSYFIIDCSVIKERIDEQ